MSTWSVLPPPEKLTELPPAMRRPPEGQRYGHWYDLEAGERLRTRRKTGLVQILPPQTRKAVAAARRVQIFTLSER